MAVCSISISVALFALGSAIASAYTTGTYGSGTYGSCDYGVACTISLTSNGAVSLNLTPNSSGSCTIQSDTASVTTDDSNGYTLTLADSGTNTALVNGTHSISTTSGTINSPTTLSGNSWGFRVDGLGGFGPGTTSAQTNASRGSTVFAGIQPSTGTPDTIALTSAAANPAVTTVWYGVCADTSVDSGIYSTQVLYTAVAN